MGRASLNVKNAEKLSVLTTGERVAVLEFASAVRKRFGSAVKEIILFGSRGRGTGDKESDIDILIVLTSLSWEIKKTISELAAETNLKEEVTAMSNPTIEPSKNQALNMLVQFPPPEIVDEAIKCA